VNDTPETKYVVGMRAVESAAAKLARPVRIERDALLNIGKKLAAGTGASRVAYDVSIKPPATIEFE